MAKPEERLFTCENASFVDAASEPAPKVSNVFDARGIIVRRLECGLATGRSVLKLVGCQIGFRVNSQLNLHRHSFADGNHVDLARVFAGTSQISLTSLLAGDRRSQFHLEEAVVQFFDGLMHSSSDN
ncbi:unnamed protein product [Soboliphyme baturini]|uniref:Type II toxin-antitoxin system PemK/MazF family toxin n=1 Tax=Soboliphyme baturini TaxID=241478 RepID=A0A183IXH1_9BILA|nr:unnamed protein product [Soboliphyme baturini]